MKKLAIIGVSGRMGAELLALAPEFQFNITEGVGRSKLAATTSSQSVTIVDHVSKLKASEADVVIDFSLPELTNDVIKWCETNKKPLVSGVTGLSADQKNAFRRAGEKIPVLWSPNMSLGIAVLSSMISQLRVLDGFDFQIEELHHIKKKDKPSGTALLLQEKLEKAIGHEAPAPVAIRGGGIFGIHRVWAMGEDETITLEHSAINRRVFARGALQAARWLTAQKPGSYSLSDVLTDGANA